MDLGNLSPFMKTVNVSRHPECDGHEAVLEINDPVGLHAFICIHRLFFHPYLNCPSALGGTRMGDRNDYPTDDDAITDGLRLSGKGMTNKAALAGTDFGGAKIVLISKLGKRGAPPDKRMRRILETYAEYLNLLNGMVVTAEDMNFSEHYLTFMREHTTWVAGASPAAGGSGNPSPYTAYGVFQGIKRCLLLKFGTEDVSKFCFAVQGVGGVGLHTALLLKKEGARLIITDTDERQLEKARATLGGADVASPEIIHRAKADVFVPCAKGAILHEKSIAELQCRIVAGGANNQLATPEDGYRLFRRGIAYGVDYVMNAAGLMSVAKEFEPQGHIERKVRTAIARIIPQNLSRIFVESGKKHLPESAVADKLARQIIRGKTSGKALW